MKNITLKILALIFGIGLFISCSSSGIETKEPDNSLSILFVDKTISLDENSEEIIQKLEEESRNFLEKNISNSGDEIIISYIFSNTASPANRFPFQYSPPAINTVGIYGINKELMEIEHLKRIKKYKEQFISKVLHKMFDLKADGSSTNVIGSIPTMKEIIEKTKANNINVLYLSDMKETSSFRFLKFNSCCDGSIINVKQAVELAEKDFIRVKKTFLMEDFCLKNINTISVVFPTERLDEDGSYELLPHYWRTLFKDFGITNISFQ